MKRMKRLVGFWLLGLIGWMDGARGEERAVVNPIPLAIALRLGPTEVTRLVDPCESERGQDEAAELYTAALRTKTEYMLALRDVQQLGPLTELRGLLTECRCSLWQIAAVYNGGGTMWGHLEEREVAPVEDFLAKLAPRFPLGTGAGSPETKRLIDRAVAHLKSLQTERRGERDMREAIAETVSLWARLQTRVSHLPKTDAEAIVRFALELALTFDRLPEG